MNAILEVEALSKHFEGTSVLNEISFKVREGEFVAIMGQSGSGKSTLLYNISGMDRPSGGKVMLRGKDISVLSDERMSEVRLKQMGFIFQHSYLLKNLSIRDNIVLPGFKAGSLPRDKVNRIAEELMSKMGIAGVAGHNIMKVSGGQLQRAAICRALINRPDILFGDEPTGSLNSSTTREVMDIINNINEDGTTVILVTHDAKVAARASRIIYLIDGSIHSELVLGAFKGEAAQTAYRERRLGNWLEKQGF